ncbi:SRPBCC family protein [Streptomyces sp. NPDC007991]|uniref:SRPBCC family protein n=1 Tax=Streptomyces sp. NPDC007991 TaxID=3364803 RepID=UPI0036E1D736
MEMRVEESIEIEVPPSVVYEAVTNVADMGRWSPECTGGEVKGEDILDRQVKPGMRFTGHNASAKRRWSTHCTVTAAEPGQKFTFLAKAAGLRISIWSYRFEPLSYGRATKVTETWIDERGWFMRFIGPRVSGIHDRAAYNRQSMRTTLERLKETLEKDHQSA